MSFLRADGLAEAADLPLWRVHEEVDLAQDRVNSRLHTEAVIAQAAFAASQSKKAFGPFKQLLERLLP